jgi:hypothetical protein
MYADFPWQGYSFYLLVQIWIIVLNPFSIPDVRQLQQSRSALFGAMLVYGRFWHVLIIYGTAIATESSSIVAQTGGLETLVAELIFNPLHALLQCIVNNVLHYRTRIGVQHCDTHLS